MVQHGRLGRPGGARVVVRRDAVQELGALRAPSPSACSSISRRPRWTWPSSRPSSVGAKAGPRESSSVRPHVVDERRREHAARCAAADGAARSRGRASRRRPCARAGRPRRSGGRPAWPERPRGRGRRAPRAPSRRGPGCETSSTRNSRKPCSSVGVAAHRRRQGRRVDVGRLERPHVELEPVAEALDAAEHAHRVALAEAAVEQLDVVPDARVDAPGRVDELEHEVRRAALRAQPPLRLDGEDALDDAVLGQVRDHARESSG